MSTGILLLTDSGDRHGFVAERLIASGLPIAGVITHAKRDARKQRQNARPFPADPELRTALRTVKRQRRDAECQAFAGAFTAFQERHGWRIVDRVQDSDESINDPRFRTLIEEFRPAVVAVMGTAMLSRALLQSGPAFVNMHTGLSPYYRGGRTNMWPIVEGDFGYFGVTIHRITPGIDDGGIYATRRILVQQGDDYARINCRAIDAGTTALIEVLTRLLEHPHRTGIAQWTPGKLFLDRHFTPEAARLYIQRLPGFVAEHLDRQTKERLDPVRLIDPDEAFA